MTANHLPASVSQPRPGQSGSNSALGVYTRSNAVREMSQQLLHRSVPPHNRDFILDMHSQNPDYKPIRSVRTAPVSCNTASEYASRFKYKPKTKIKVMGLDSKTLLPLSASKIRVGCLPSVKRKSLPSSRRSTRAYNLEDSIQFVENTSINLELSPVQFADFPRHMQQKWHQDVPPIINALKRMPAVPRDAIKTNDSPVLLQHIPSEEQIRHQDHILLAQKAMPMKETPWVYRYKIKKEMNHLTKIMASKSPGTPDGLKPKLFGSSAYKKHFITLPALQ